MLIAAAGRCRPGRPSRPPSFGTAVSSCRPQPRSIPARLRPCRAAKPATEPWWTRLWPFSDEKAQKDEKPTAQHAADVTVTGAKAGAADRAAADAAAASASELTHIAGTRPRTEAIASPGQYAAQGREVVSSISRSFRHRVLQQNAIIRWPTQRQHARPASIGQTLLPEMSSKLMLVATTCAGRTRTRAQFCSHQLQAPMQPRSAQRKPLRPRRMRRPAKPAHRQAAGAHPATALQAGQTSPTFRRGGRRTLQPTRGPSRAKPVAL